LQKGTLAKNELIHTSRVSFSEASEVWPHGIGQCVKPWTCGISGTRVALVAKNMLCSERALFVVSHLCEKKHPLYRTLSLD
jgi:hypothetical protein